jgi:hypothetical protein
MNTQTVVPLVRPLANAEEFFKTVGSWGDLPAPSRLTMSPTRVELVWVVPSKALTVELNADLPNQRVSLVCYAQSPDGLLEDRLSRAQEMSLRDPLWTSSICNALMKTLG